MMSLIPLKKSDGIKMETGKLKGSKIARWGAQMMTEFDWEQKIRTWSADVLAELTEEEKAELPTEAIASVWLGYAGATEEQIARAEARLGTALPPSYRQFLKVSNGLLDPFFADESGFYSTEEVDWLCVRNQDLIDIWTSNLQDVPSLPDAEYFAYGQEQDPCYLRNEHMRTALEISCGTDGYLYLLNPQVIGADGEWEAWDFGTKIPGAYRYKSFQDMMEFFFAHPLK